MESYDHSCAKGPWHLKVGNVVTDNENHDRNLKTHRKRCLPETKQNKGKRTEKQRKGDEVLCNS